MTFFKGRALFVLAVWAASAAPALAEDDAKTQNRDQASSSATLASVIDGWFHCDMIEPMVAMDPSAPVRPGAILSGVSIYKYNKKFAGFNLTDSDNACTPKSALPAGIKMLKTLTYNYNVSADAALTLEIEKLITGISLSAEYLDQISIKISDSKLYLAEADDIDEAITSIKGRPGCARVFKRRPVKDDFLSAPIIVKNACVGNVKLDYKWKKAVHAALLQAQLGSLKVGFNANFKTSNLEETPCPAPAAAPAGTKTGDTPAGAKSKTGAAQPAASGKADGTTATNAQLKDALVAGLNALADYLKKLADEAVAKGLPDAADKVAAANKAKADAAAAAASPAPTAAADAGKCYVGYSIESDGPVVFGVNHRPLSMYLTP